MSVTDKAFASGLTTAAQIARRAAVSIQETQTGAKWQGARAALAALADDLDALASPPTSAMQSVPHGVETVDIVAHRAQAKAQGYTGGGKTDG